MEAAAICLLIAAGGFQKIHFVSPFMVREISVWRRLALGEGDKRKYPDPIAVSGKTTGDPSIGSPV